MDGLTLAGTLGLERGPNFALFLFWKKCEKKTFTKLIQTFLNIIRQDLRHFDNLLGIGHERVEETHDVRQLFNHLRHRCIENLHYGSDTHEVSDVLHYVPLDPLLRPGLGENSGPHPRGVFVKQLEEHRIPGCFGLLSPWSSDALLIMSPP